MRAFVLMLLVANLAFFGWQYLGEPNEKAEVKVQDETRAAPSSATAVPTLVLLSEVPPVAIDQEASTGEGGEQSVADEETHAMVNAAPTLETVEKEVEVTTTVAPPPLPQCYKIGPFAQRKAPEEMVALAERYGFDAAITARQVERLFGEWVYLTGYDTLRAARADVGALKASGVKDISIARLEDGQLIISLGIFSKKATLQTRLAEVERLGYVNHQQRKRYRKAEEFWLVLSGFAGEPQRTMVNALSKMQVERFLDAELQTVDCG